MSWLRRMWEMIKKAFTAGSEPAPSPPVEPSPPPEPAVKDAIDPSQVTWCHANPSGFPVTATLENVRIAGFTISWDWTQPNWAVPPYFVNGVVGNHWVFAKIAGHWYAATWEWLRPTTTRVTLEARPGQPPFVQTKIWPLNCWYPQPGEEVGFMTSTVCRGGIPAGMPTGRSRIALVKWP